MKPIGWDAQAYRDTCERHGIPAILERSRSGNGAHVWIFFCETVPAKLVRSLGSLLLTETIERRSGITLKSYDRFFPNQDTLPRLGFGNLIALPLLRGARNHVIRSAIGQVLWNNSPGMTFPPFRQPWTNSPL